MHFEMKVIAPQTVLSGKVGSLTIPCTFQTLFLEAQKPLRRQSFAGYLDIAQLGQNNTTCKRAEKNY
jgi:hypothetical protein